MKKQNPSIKAQIIRSAFILLLTLAVCAIPFALAQRNAAKRSVKQSAPFKKVPSPSQPFMAPGGVLPPLSPWTVVAPYPLIIESTAVCSDGTYAYSAGGFSSAASSAFYRYDPVANTWTPLAPLPSPLYDAHAAYSAINNSVYVFGGTDGFVTLNTTYRYNVATNTWTTVAPMPDFRLWPNVAYYAGNGKIYVIGGLDSGGIEQGQTWEYDPLANTWITTRTSDPTPQAGAGTTISGQYIYLAGANGGSTVHNRYDIVNNVWASMAAVPVPIFQPGSGNIVGQNYLFGGGNPFDSS